MLTKHPNLQSPDSVESGKPDLQSCFRAAGLPHAVTFSPRLAARCGWLESPAQGVDPYVIAWASRLVLTGQWLHRRCQTQYGEVLLVEFPAFVTPKETINLSLGILVENYRRLKLVDPDELDQPVAK
jgi:hypothetical protein